MWLKHILRKCRLLGLNGKNEPGRLVMMQRRLLGYLSRVLLTVALFLLMMPCLAQAPHDSGQSLPSPLTLAHALTLVSEAHPVLAQARASVDIATADRLTASAQSDMELGIDARLRWVEPSPKAVDQRRQDHFARLYVRQLLFDFGRVQGLLDANDKNVLAQEYLLHYQNHQQRIAVMESFFDVILADMEYAHANETMAIQFIRYDRMRDRHELGQQSEVDVLSTHSDYQLARQVRHRKQLNQRVTRARLAQQLNQPKLLPDKLVKPQLMTYQRVLPDVNQLLARLDEANLLLQALQIQLQSAQDKIKVARLGHYPSLYSEAEVAQYARNSGSSDRWRIGLVMNFPFYTGDRVKAGIHKQQALHDALQAQFREKKRQLEQLLLELTLNLENLSLQREQANASLEYRQLYLDRARALYEQEKTPDLGDAMIKLTYAELVMARVDFEIALTWEKLNVITGKTLVD